MAQWVEVGHKTDDLSSVLGIHITMWKDLEESTLPCGKDQVLEVML